MILGGCTWQRRSAQNGLRRLLEGRGRSTGGTDYDENIMKMIKIKHILWQWGQSTDWQDVMTNLWRKEKLSVIDAMSGDNYSNDENDGNDDNDEN